MTTALVECVDLIKIHKQGSLEVVALHGLNFSMEEGEFVSVVGASGAGKSTLLRVLAGLEQPSAGSVSVDGVDVSGIDRRDLTQYYRRNVGFLWQDFHRNLLPYLKVRANVELPMLLAGVGARKRKARALALLEAVGLRNLAFAKVGTMSGGEQQRLAMCVALAMQPKLLLADEPTGELDTHSSLGIYELLRGMCETEGLTVLVVTHDAALATRTDRVVRLADGRLVTTQGGSTEALVQVSGDGKVHLPNEMLRAAGIGSTSRAKRTDDGILLRPMDSHDA
jgi:putative ABC transport system ATP-binding protein